MGMQRPEYQDVRGFIPETLQRGFQPYWVTPDDILVASVRNAVAGLNLLFSGRIWHADGSVNEFSNLLAPTSDRTLNNFVQVLEYGWLTSVCLTVSGAPAITRGTTLGTILIARPPATAFVPKMILAQDYITTQNGPFWPYPRSVSGFEGPGRIITVTVANPAAGADWSTGLPIFGRWRIRAIRAVLATSAVVATRIAYLQINQTGLLRLMIAPSATQLAGLTVFYSGAPYAANVTQGTTEFEWALPTDFQVQNPVAIGTNTIALQAADQWGPITIIAEEWMVD